MQEKNTNVPGEKKQGGEYPETGKQGGQGDVGKKGGEVGQGGDFGKQGDTGKTGGNDLGKQGRE
jgi:hypothetical protein